MKNKIAKTALFILGLILVSTQTLAEPKQIQRPSPSKKQELVSMSFENADIRSVLQTLAKLSNTNLVLSQKIQGKISIQLQNVSWQQALDSILQSQGLVQESLDGESRDSDPGQRSSILNIRTHSEATEDKKTKALQLETRSFSLNYAKAKEVEQQLGALVGKEGGGFLGEGGAAFAELRTNQLFVTGTPERLEQIAHIIAQIDIPLQQVLIEAQVVLVDAGFGRNLGVRFGGYYLRKGQEQTFGLGASGIQLNQLVGGGGDADLSFGNLVNLPAASLGASNPASVALALFNPALGSLLNLEISALEAEGKSRVLSQPRVVTTDKNKAVIEQGTELPYQVVGANGAASLQFRKAILKLEVLPRITPQGDILLDLTVNKDRVGGATGFGFAIDTKHIQTQVLVENGGTVAIGGIYEESVRSEESKVPVLGDIPGLGVLFRSSQQQNDKNELLILVTPRIVSAQRDML